MINLLRHCQRGKLVLRNFKFTYTPKVNLSTEDNQQRTESSTEKKSSVLSFEEASKITEDKVKKLNYYAFVIGQALPEKIRPFYYSYQAFFSEITRSRYITREQSVCRMRLSFWEDSLKNCLTDKVTQEPTLVLLKEAFKKTGIRKETLFRMIDYQYYDIDRNGELHTMEELEVYAENTNSLIIYLNLNLFNINERDAYIAASHLGRGIGITSVLKRMPVLIKQHICQIPFNVLDKYNVSMTNAWDRHGDVKGEFFDAVLEIAAYAKKHIEVGRMYNGKLPKNTHVAFLEAVEAYEWLMELEQYNFNVFEPNLAKVSLSKIPKMIIDYGKNNNF